MRSSNLISFFLCYNLLGDFMIPDTIHGHYNSFFDSEKKIADYIIQHPKEVVNMTIKELAQACNTSQASV